MMKTACALGPALGGLLFAVPALADNGGGGSRSEPGGRAGPPDKVVVLPFQGDAKTEEARNATSGAVLQKAHTPLGEDETKKAVAAVSDGVPDTSAEFRQAGKAVKAQWTLVGRVENHDWYYRIELEACQVDSGRVESLSRNIDPQKATAMIGDMVALLLRPEGIGAGNPWA